MSFIYRENIDSWSICIKEKMMIKKIINKIYCSKNPIKFWEKRGVKIGKDCEIYPSASFGSEPYLIYIGDHVRINSGVHFVTHDGGAWVLRNYLNDNKNKEKIDIFGKIKIGNNVHIGTNAIIMPGVTIGNNCIIGCGAIVTKSIPDNSIAAGVPARIIETINEYAEKNKSRFEYTKHMSYDEKKIYLLNKYSAL